jgi:hypothetical protein
MRGQGKYRVGNSKSEIRNSKCMLMTLVVSSCLGTNPLRAASTAEIYQQIPARNLFGLHEPIVKPPETIAPVLPKVTLTGITTMGSKLAFLKVQSQSKPGEQPQGDLSLMLAEGQREEGVEILEINERTGTVRINNSGTEMTIGFDKDAGKVTSNPPPGAGPKHPPPYVAGRLRELNPTSPGFQRVIPTRTGSQVPAAAQPQPPPVPGQPLIQQQTTPTEKPLTPNEEAILKELEQAAQNGQAQPR